MYKIVYNYYTLSNNRSSHERRNSMPSIVYQIDKKTGAKYAYESTSYWDKEKQQPRSTRKYIGKVDPETGEIIRKKDRKAPSADADSMTVTEIERLRNDLSQKDQVIADLKEQLAEMTKAYDSLQKIIKRASAILTMGTEDEG